MYILSSVEWTHMYASMRYQHKMCMELLYLHSPENKGNKQYKICPLGILPRGTCIIIMSNALPPELSRTPIELCTYTHTSLSGFTTTHITCIHVQSGVKCSDKKGTMQTQDSFHPQYFKKCGEFMWCGILNYRYQENCVCS